MNLLAFQVEKSDTINESTVVNMQLINFVEYKLNRYFKPLEVQWNDFQRYINILVVKMYQSLMLQQYS